MNRRQALLALSIVALLALVASQGFVAAPGAAQAGQLFIPLVLDEQPRPTPTVTETPWPTLPPHPTPTETPTPTPGPSPTPYGDVTVTGQVYRAGIEPRQGIAGADVSVGVCVPRQPFHATTGADGRYTLLVPGYYLTTCSGGAVRFEVHAAGYQTYSVPIPPGDLVAQPQRDVPLTAE